MALVLESEKDANYLINEINNGLRSNVPAEQSQALLKFPILVHRYPFPVVINAIFSKIVDLFRDGSNFQRLSILYVCQQCAQHLDSSKVRNSDYVIKIVLGVCHSNDPSARALAVRLLASLPGLTADNCSVHSAVCSALDSHWPVELEAAVWATHRLAPLSPALSRGAADRLLASVGDLRVDPRTKLALYAACCSLGRAGGDAIGLLLDRLRGELVDCPATEAQSVLLRVLTRLSLMSPASLPATLQLHCRRLLSGKLPDVENSEANDGDDRGDSGGETRPRLRRILLANLLAMAGPAAAHHWTLAEVCRLVRFIEAATATAAASSATPAGAEDALVVDDGLQVAGALAYGDAYRLLLEAGLLPLLRRIVYADSADGVGIGVALALDVAVRIAVANGDADLAEELAALLADRLPRSVAAAVEPALNRLLGAWHSLLGRFPHLGDVLFTPDLLADLLNAGGGDAQRHLGIRAVRCLASLTVRCRPGIDCADWLAGWLSKRQDGASAEQIEAACALLFKTDCCRVGRPLPSQDAAVLSSLGGLNNWQAYRIARAASKHGRLGLAGQIFDQLVNSAQERPAFWLRGLALLCQAEANGSAGFQDVNEEDPLARLDEWCERLREALASFVSANGTGGDPGALWFPVAFAGRRFHFVAACQSFATLAYQLQPGRLAAVQLAAAADEADAEAAAARRLRAACVDADPGSLAQVDCLAWQMTALASLMRALAAYDAATDNPPPPLPLIIPTPSASPTEDADKDDPMLDDADAGSAESAGQVAWQRSQLPYACATQCQLMQSIVDTCWDRLTQLRSQHSLNSPAGRELLLETLWRLLRCPFCLPRYFFQRLQRTRISLHVTPARRAAANPEPVKVGVDYVLKVEGVVEQTGPVLLRRLASVAVVVAVRPHSTAASGSDIAAGFESATSARGGWQQRLTATLPVPTDYFSKQFVLSFNRRPGLYLIKVHVHPIDKTGAQWSAVEKERVYVRVSN
ncbi:hypothetical protein BOX15_Mlig014450g1 [Macrostomum lignano]|uniref:Integrator complex subunit 7 n=1 Tax=Macrostomum lignano TaxID=282301 RepID=A0A267DWK4_9PLAT|nr:hypothetical protein BOX15_Mlig025636g2 [Macrostomum lignano]PAA61553.1 hypothetical protein BOX15_Mlig014450g1 [Macrostomum lignano]